MRHSRAKRTREFSTALLKRSSEEGNEGCFLNSPVTKQSREWQFVSHSHRPYASRLDDGEHEPDPAFNRQEAKQESRRTKNENKKKTQRTDRSFVYAVSNERSCRFLVCFGARVGNEARVLLFFFSVCHDFSTSPSLRARRNCSAAWLPNGQKIEFRSQREISFPV